MPRCCKAWDTCKMFALYASVPLRGLKCLCTSVLLKVGIKTLMSGCSWGCYRDQRFSHSIDMLDFIKGCFDGKQLAQSTGKQTKTTNKQNPQQIIEDHEGLLLWGTYWSKTSQRLCLTVRYLLRTCHTSQGHTACADPVPMLLNGNCDQQDEGLWIMARI